MENDNDKKFTYYLRIRGYEFWYRAYARPVEELQEAEQDNELADYLDDNFSADKEGNGPSVNNLENTFLEILDANENLVREIALSQLGIEKVEECAFPECKEDEAAAYIIEWGDGIPCCAEVDLDIDLSEISIEELKDNITIRYNTVKYWDDSKRIKSETIVEYIECFGHTCWGSEGADLEGNSKESYIVKDDDEEEN